ncbi:MAG TPA: hypothetical protein VFF79_14340, partial [Conexibacter sp.]|nr:hypothetical protein [Conexibacter sp.]
ASLLAVVALLGGWVDRQLLNTDDWTATSAALLRNDTIRVPLADELSSELADGSRTTQALQSALPPRLRPLAGPAGSLVADAVQRAVQRVLASGKVQQLWVTANRLTHEQFVNLVNGGGTVVTQQGVVLDLRPLAKQIAAQVGIDPSVVDRLPASRGRIVIVQPQKLKQLRRAGDALGVLSWLPGVLALALYALAVWLAGERPGGRRRALLASGFGLAIAALLVLVVRRIAGNQVVDAVTNGGPLEPAAQAVWQTATTLLAELAVVVLIVGSGAVAGAWLAGDGRRASWLRARLAPGLAARPELAFGIAGVTYLVLVAWGPLSVLRRPLAIVILGVLLAVGVAALRAQVQRELAVPGAGDAPPPTGSAAEPTAAEGAPTAAADPPAQRDAGPPATG